MKSLISIILYVIFTFFLSITANSTTIESSGCPQYVCKETSTTTTIWEKHTNNISYTDVTTYSALRINHIKKPQISRTWRADGTCTIRIPDNLLNRSAPWMNRWRLNNSITETRQAKWTTFDIQDPEECAYHLMMITRNNYDQNQNINLNSISLQTNLINTWWESYDIITWSTICYWISQNDPNEPTDPVNPVPEPSTVLMFIFGIVIFIVSSIKKTNSF